MKKIVRYPVIDVEATGRNIERLRKRCGLTVQDLQEFFEFSSPGAIYQWQRGECLPSVDNLYALSAILKVSMNEILVAKQDDRAGKRPFPWGAPLSVLLRSMFPLPQAMAA